MIKHRFILRDEDFKIFAAIPVESSLLMWKVWMRPPDWNALDEVHAGAIEGLTALWEAWIHIADLYEALADVKLTVSNDAEAMGWDRADALKKAMADMSDTRRSQSVEARNAAASLGTAIDEVHTNRVVASREFVMVAGELAAILDPLKSLTDMRLETLRSGTHDEMDYYRKIAARIVGNQKKQGLYKAAKSIADLYFKVYDIFEKMIVLKETLARGQLLCVGLISSEPLPTTPCPPGLPFAAYTVEFGGVVVNVVEGQAWIARQPTSEAKIEEVKRTIAKELDAVPRETAREAIDQLVKRLASDISHGKPYREPTPEEKRVVEIVSQMLTERSLNPKADTKIPVREVDPKRAHQTREAEKRATTPAVRTIKFEVSPPRYLREAAEHILTSPRRAHWVIGHWRNQPYGAQRALHRQMWIKPHIRGLGEASATTARVVAPHPERTT